MDVQTAEALSSVLRSNDTLREVDVSGNALGVEGGRLLGEAVAENTYAHKFVPVLERCRVCFLRS